jgi:nucleoside-diphosphate-sugar epimerase
MTIHFAAMKAVGESRQIPLTYYDNNISGSVNLLRVMDAYNCKRIIFSSSCTVYGSVAKSPLSEDSPVGEGLTNAYATTKYMMETILRDLYSCYPEWTIIILRYFINKITFVIFKGLPCFLRFFGILIFFLCKLCFLLSLVLLKIEQNVKTKAKQEK